MSLKRFQPGANLDEVIAALRGGMSPKECAAKFGISIRTAFRYLKEIRELSPIAPATQAIPTMSMPVKISLEMSSSDFSKLLQTIREIMQ